MTLRFLGKRAKAEKAKDKAKADKAKADKDAEAKARQNPKLAGDDMRHSTFGPFTIKRVHARGTTMALQPNVSDTTGWTAMHVPAALLLVLD